MTIMTNATRRRTYYRLHREKILAEQKTPEAREHVRQLHHQRSDEINARRRKIYETKLPDTDKRRKQKSEAMQRWWAKNRAAYLASLYAKRLEKMEREAGRPRPDKCEVCERSNGRHGGIMFDHCHRTGKFRGWICYSCNTTLGHVNDDPKILRALIAYLEHG